VANTERGGSNPPLPPSSFGVSWPWPLTKTDIPPRHSTGRTNGVWPLLNWVALSVVLIGTVLAYLGFQRVITPPPLVQTLETPIKTVATGAPVGATETNSIGQQRVVRTSNGYLLSLFGSSAGLSVVSDLGDHGRSWRAPVTLPAIEASSLSATIDGRDRIHLAFVNDEGPAFAILSRDAGGWRSSNIVQLDAGTSPIVDVAWDEQRQLAHVVWVGEGDGDQVVRWASLGSDTLAQVSDTKDLAVVPSGTALANVAADGNGHVIVTYRKGEAAGWYSRLFYDDTSGWQPEEALPTKIDARAGSVALDPRGVAHVVLIDQDGKEMTYLKRSHKGWIAPQVVIPQGTTEEMDDPFLATDAASRLLYTFFSTTGTAEAVRMVVRDPATGWEDPYRVSLEDNSTEGYAPTSLDPLTGTPLVLWTSVGADPSIRSGNIVLP